MTQLIFKIIIIGLITGEVILAFLRHGDVGPRVNFFQSLISNILLIILLALAGFFSNSVLLKN